MPRWRRAFDGVIAASQKTADYASLIHPTSYKAASILLSEFCSAGANVASGCGVIAGKVERFCGWQLLSSNTKMANDGVDAFTWHSQPSSLLRQPGLYPCDRSPAQPADLRKLTPRVQGYDLGKENGAIGIASHDERCVRRIRHQLNDPVRQIRAGSDGNLLCSCHMKQLDPGHDGSGEFESF